MNIKPVDLIKTKKLIQDEIDKINKIIPSSLVFNSRGQETLVKTLREVKKDVEKLDKSAKINKLTELLNSSLRYKEK